MKPSIYPLLLLLLFSDCKKESSNFSVSEKEPVQTKELEFPPLFGCDDTSFFKSSVDLETLIYLHDCFSCTATKEVPGLGSIPWAGNPIAKLIDGKLTFEFSTYKPNFDELYLREMIYCGHVPLNLGYQPVYDTYHFQQNTASILGSYSRSISDGDVLDGLWEVDTTCTNFIAITQLDLEDKEVHGNFEVHLKMVLQGQNGILYSERINFIDGKFYARIIEF